MTRILLVDDQQLLRRGLRMLLELEDGLEVVAEAADGQEALTVLRGCSVDVVLTDARMPGMDGITLVQRLAELHPGLPAVVLTTFDDEDIITGAMSAGAAGFLLKDVSTTRLAEALHEVAAGGLVIDPRVARLALGRGAQREDPLAVLTRTERLVAEQVARGATNGEIAAAMHLSEGTVKNHVSALLRKLEQRDRTGLALTLYRLLQG
ncbi:response regulator [Luteococcus sp. OSA5]|uniref:response regulator n=1 Tax=Luteococcus sp. OSA5 TaxID=3401630 RepID=UPI003B4298FB